MDKNENNKFRLELINSWISNCDTKSSFLLALNGIVLTFMLSSDFSDKIRKTLSYRLGEVDFFSIVNFIEFTLLVLLFISILTCFYNIYYTLIGRVNPNFYKQQDLVTESNLFFGTIAEKKYSDFFQKIEIEDEIAIRKDLTSQIMINAKIAKMKFEYYNRSILFTFGNLILGFLYFLI